MTNYASVLARFASWSHASNFGVRRLSFFHDNFGFFGKTTTSSAYARFDVRFNSMASSVNNHKGSNKRKGYSTDQQSFDGVQHEILALGKEGQWKKLLQLFMDKKPHFKPIHYATLLTQLGRIRTLYMDDSRLEAIIMDLNVKFDTFGIK